MPVLLKGLATMVLSLSIIMPPLALRLPPE